jgi:ABC-type polysaccharide/polyol phosphate transport system ATPase subunit
VEKLAIKVDDVSKIYKLYANPIDRLKEIISITKRNRHKDFVALDQISFHINKGETVGIIGKNGSGKSTILKMITGVLTPTSGQIMVNGKISSLLELGAGFNPEYNGIENIYLNGTVMGFSRQEMDQKIDEILAFADIGDFVYQPIKTYSSGMYVRLAFAAAINVDPDILIVDEALAVGDISFQSKCFRKFESLKEAGKTILLVTHSMDMVARHCDRAILIQEGHLLADGLPKDVINNYTRIMTSQMKSKSDISEIYNSTRQLIDHYSSEELLGIESFFGVESVEQFHLRKRYNPNEFRWGDGRGKIIDYMLLVDSNLEPEIVFTGQKIELYVKFMFFQNVEELITGLVLKTLDGVIMFGQNTRNIGLKVVTNPSMTSSCIVKYSFVNYLTSGKYLISVGCSEGLNIDQDQLDTLAIDRRNDSIILEVVNNAGLPGLIDPQVIIEQIFPS